MTYKHAEVVLSMRCTVCGVSSTVLDYGLCSKCSYVPKKVVAPRNNLGFRVIHDPDDIYSRNAEFSKAEFQLTLTDGCWPDGLVIEYQGKVAKVVNGDDGRGRLVWYGTGLWEITS